MGVLPQSKTPSNCPGGHQYFGISPNQPERFFQVDQIHLLWPGLTDFKPRKQTRNRFISVLQSLLTTRTSETEIQRISLHIKQQNLKETLFTLCFRPLFMVCIAHWCLYSNPIYIYSYG